MKTKVYLLYALLVVMSIYIVIKSYSSIQKTDKTFRDYIFEHRLQSQYNWFLNYDGTFDSSVYCLYNVGDTIQLNESLYILGRDTAFYLNETNTNMYKSRIITVNCLYDKIE